MRPGKHPKRCLPTLVVAIVLVPTALRALPVEQIPNPRLIKGNWVTDAANILQPETERKLNTLIDQLQAANGSEMAVVSVPDSKPEGSTKQLATKLFNTWGIGQKGKDNGILFLISVGDRRVEIETGYGLEAILPDAKVGQVIQQRITPRFKAGDFDAGTLSGTEAIVQLVQGQEIERTPERPGMASLQGLAGLPLMRGLGQVNPGVLVILFGFAALVPDWVLASRARRSQSQPKAARGQEGLSRLKGLAGLALMRGLGQAVKLHPSQSSRVPLWRLRFETVGSMRCAICGDLLEPIEPGAVEERLRASEKAAAGLGSLQFRGWRCRRCNPESMHLRGYESQSNRFGFCPRCQELTVSKNAPYVIPNPSSPGYALRITNSHCVNCDYTHQEEFIQSNGGDGSSDRDFGGGSSRDSGSSGGDFGGGSSGGGGAGDSW